MYKNITYHIFNILLDAIHAIIQSSRQVKASEMVCSTPRQAEEENNKRTDYHCACSKAKNVLIFGMERC